MLTVVLLIISGLFILGILARQITKIHFCTLCLSIILTWLGLLASYLYGSFDDVVLVSLLVGQSITGLYFFIRDRVPRSLKIFTLPFFLSLTAAGYMMIKTDLIMSAFAVLLGLWATAWLIFSYRSDPGKKPVATALMECCED